MNIIIRVVNLVRSLFIKEKGSKDEVIGWVKTIMLRLFLTVVLVFLICVGNVPQMIVFAEGDILKKYDDVIPPPIKIDEIYRTDPFVIYRIVQRMYLIEHVNPVLDLPRINFFLDKKNNLYAQYKNSIYISLGHGLLHYQFDVNPQIVHGLAPKDKAGFSTQTKVFMITGLFVLGILIGAGGTIYLQK